MANSALRRHENNQHQLSTSTAIERRIHTVKTYLKGKRSFNKPANKVFDQASLSLPSLGWARSKGGTEAFIFTHEIHRKLSAILIHGKGKKRFFFAAKAYFRRRPKAGA